MRRESSSPGHFPSLFIYLLSWTWGNRELQVQFGWRFAEKGNKPQKWRSRLLFIFHSVDSVCAPRWVLIDPAIACHVAATRGIMTECSVTSFLDELVVMTSNLCPMVYLLSVHFTVCICENISICSLLLSSSQSETPEQMIMRSSCVCPRASPLIL